MRVAQDLYENGYITYMRTDSVNLSDQAINAARRRIRELYGEEFLNPAPRRYQTKTANAQEAHEAIRPAGDQMRTADELPLEGRAPRAVRPDLEAHDRHRRWPTRACAW